jgi:type II secretory pathway pseudopilin PulG
LNLFAYSARGAAGLLAEASAARRGSSLVEVVVAMAVTLVGLLAFGRTMTESLQLGEQNRQLALATAAAQRAVEELYAAEFSDAFALYNEDPDDDPDGSGTAPGAQFVAEGLVAADGSVAKGTISFPVLVATPGELREDLNLAKFQPFDVDLDGATDAADHSADYQVLPVRVQVQWMDGKAQRELAVETILGRTQ